MNVREWGKHELELQILVDPTKQPKIIEKKAFIIIISLFSFAVSSCHSHQIEFKLLRMNNTFFRVVFIFEIHRGAVFRMNSYLIQYMYNMQHRTNIRMKGNVRIGMRVFPVYFSFIPIQQTIRTN